MRWHWSYVSVALQAFPQQQGLCRIIREGAQCWFAHPDPWSFIIWVLELVRLCAATILDGGEVAAVQFVRLFGP